MQNDDVKFKISGAGANSYVSLLVLVISFLLPVYLVKFKFGWISFNLLELLIFILLIVWLFGKNTKYQIPNTRYPVPTALIFAGLLLSTIANKNYYVGLGAIKGWFVFPIIFAVIAYDLLEGDRRLLKKIFSTLFASGFFLSLMGIYYGLSRILTYDGRLRMFFDSPNQLVMFLGPAFIIGVILCADKTRTHKRIFYLFGLILIGLNICLTHSLGAALAIGASIIVVFYLKYKKYRERTKIILIAILLLAAMLWMGTGKIRGVELTGNRSSLASREMIWESAGLMVKNNPLFGIGPGNFQNKYLEYQKYFPPYLEWAVPQPHNIFLAFWLESGLVGLVGFILLLIYFFRDNKKALRANREAALMCLGVILYFLIHGLVDTTYWRNDMAVVFWMMVAVNLYLGQIKYENIDTEK